MKFLDPYLGALKATIILALVLGIFAAGHRFGAQGVQAAWDKERAERVAADNAAILSRVKNNERIAEQQALDNDRIRKGYEDEIARIRADRARAPGLRVTADVCTGLAGAAKTEGTGGSDAAVTGTIALPAQVDRDLRQLMEEADEVVAGCRAAQDFIVTNGMAP